MATIQELETRRAKLQEAKDEIIFGNRLTKGDLEGMGNAEFQTVKLKDIDREIDKVNLQISRIKGTSRRFSGTPRLGGL